MFIFCENFVLLGNYCYVFKNKVTFHPVSCIWCTHTMDDICHVLANLSLFHFDEGTFQVLKEFQFLLAKHHIAFFKTFIKILSLISKIKVFISSCSSILNLQSIILLPKF